MAHILGQDLWRAGRSVRSRIVYISQTQQVHNWMTLAELCRYTSHLYPRWEGAYAQTLTQRWRLSPAQRIGTMSMGDQRKAALLVALASRPDVLILDEPAAGLDPIARRALLDEMIAMMTRGDGCTVLFSTHLLQDLERVVDHIGIMDGGRLVMSSPLDELQSSIKRVQVVFPGETVPADFTIPGALWSERSGPVATALARLANEAQLEPIRYLPGVRLQIFSLSLEDILLAFLKDGANQSQ
jgi:ABC-2 type transport system ATP-binding protein